MSNVAQEIQVPLSLPIDVLDEIPSDYKAVKKLGKLFRNIIQLDEFNKYSLLISKKYFLPLVLELMIEKNITFKEALEICRERKFDLFYNNVNVNIKDNFIKSLVKKALIEQLRQLKENEKVISIKLSMKIDIKQVLDESLVLYRTQKIVEDLTLKDLIRKSIVEPLQKELQNSFEEIMKKDDLNDFDKTVFTYGLNNMQADIENNYFSFPLGFILSEVIKNAIKEDIKFSEAVAYINFDIRSDFLEYIEETSRDSSYIEQNKIVYNELFNSVYEQLRINYAFKVFRD